jgi:hypothetical protein
MTAAAVSLAVISIRCAVVVVHPVAVSCMRQKVCVLHGHAVQLCMMFANAVVHILSQLVVLASITTVKQVACEDMPFAARGGNCAVQVGGWVGGSRPQLPKRAVP